MTTMFTQDSKRPQSNTSSSRQSITEANQDTIQWNNLIQAYQDTIYVHNKLTNGHKSNPPQSNTSKSRHKLIKTQPNTS